VMSALNCWCVFSGRKERRLIDYIYKMVKCYVLISCLFIHVAVNFAQAPAKNLEIKSAISPKGFVYLGLDNPITIKAAGIKPGNLMVTVKGGGAMISKTDSAYSLRIMSMEGDSVVITVKQKKGSSYKLLGSGSFKIKRVPDPYISYGGKKFGERMSKGACAAVKYLFAKMDWDVNVKFVVQSFDLAVGTKKYTAASNQLTAEMLEAIQAMKPGKIIFSGVAVKGSDGTTRTFPDTEFFVTE
jgi:hypothetical protein